VTVLKLAEGLGGIEDVIKEVEDIDSNAQRGATTRQRTMRMRFFFLSGGSAGEEEVFFSPCFSI
jgi:hypothetical protein